MAFNADGELFVYDADMEWDFGSPWYRPTRVNHATSGSELGWRSGSGKWPACYPDSLPALIDIVRRHEGSPVIVVSHKATIRLLLSSLLGFDPRRYRDNLDQDPAALNIVDFKDAVRSRLMLFNDTSHYSEGGLALPQPAGACLSKWWNH